MNYKKTLVASAAFYPKGQLPAGVYAMLETASLHGVDVTLIGLDEPHVSNYESKLVKLLAAVRPLQDYEFVVIADAVDLLWATGLGELHYQFARYGAPFIMSGEANCWPHGQYTDRMPNAPHRFRFLNSGFYMATWPEFLDVTEKLLASPAFLHPKYARDDQGVWQDAWMRGSIRLRVEYECRLCQSLHGVNGHWSMLNPDIAWGKRPKNLVTNSYPCVFHGNGDGKRFMDGLRDMLLL